MKYLFTTLAVGADYLDNAIQCFKDIRNKTNCDFNITTNVSLDNEERINFDFFSLDRYHDDMAGFSFFLDLKSLSLKYALDKGYDYVIFIDADWRITNEFSEEKLLNLFKHMDNNELDMLAERPAEIGYYKENFDRCYFKEKILDYHLFEHNKWDRAHVFNEQFMVFKINWKFRYFIRHWEQMMWYNIANNIRNYPDGFEIGVSVLEAEMKYQYTYDWMQHVKNIFTFNNKQGETFTRF